MSTIETAVVEIGTMAYFEDYPILILFNKTAPEGLRDISVIHEFLSEPNDAMLQKGSKIIMGGMMYTVEELGHIANKSLYELGHLSMYFTLEKEATLLPGSVLLSPSTVPHLNIGDVITFVK